MKPRVADTEVMSDVADTDLEGCIRELAKRVRHDLVGKTPFEVNEYFLCQSIEHLVRLDRRDASAEVINIESHRLRGHPGCAGWQRVAFDAKPFAHDPAAAPTR
jgi:hypothetical protein